MTLGGPRVWMATLALGGFPSPGPALAGYGGDWIELRLGSVVAISSLSAGETESIAERVHGYGRDVFGAGRPFRTFEDDTLKLFLLEEEDLEAYGLPDRRAHYQEGEGVDYLLLRRERWEDALPTALATEALHRLRDLSPGIPAWVRFGLADFYSTYRVHRDRAAVGHRIDDKFEALRRDDVMPWTRVLDVGEFSPELRDPGGLATFSARAWVLVHYLITETGLGESALSRYVTRLDAGDDPETAFDEVYAFPRAELATRGSKYARTRGFDPIEFRRPSARAPSSPGTDESPLAPISRERLLVEFGEMLVTLEGERLEERSRLAEEYLREALARDPDSAPAERGLGLVSLRRGDVAAARVHLRRAVDRDPSDLRAQLLLARALLEPYTTESVRFSVRDAEPPEAIREAREHLRVCLSLDPDRADVHGLLARTYLHDPGDPTPGIRTLEKILPLAPGRRDRIDTSVRLLLRAGRPEAAFSLLDPGHPDDPWLRSLRETVAGEALRRKDPSRARDLIRGLRARREAWGLSEETTRLLESFAGLEAAGAEGSESPELSIEEIRRQHREYQRALTLCGEKRYAKAIEILDALLARPNDEALHESLVTLHDQASYNRALNLYERGEYQEALELARELRKRTSHRDIALMARQLARSCRRALEN